MPKRSVTWDSLLLYLPPDKDPNQQGWPFFVRKIYIDPMIEVPANVQNPDQKKKFFLPHPEQNVNMHFALYAENFDWEEDDFEEGIAKEGVFKIDMKLMHAIDDPNNKYVQVHIVDKKVPPEKISPNLRGEFFVTYSRTIIKKDQIRRFNHLILPHRDDFIVYAAKDIVLHPDESGDEESYETEILLYYAFYTKVGRYHLILPENKVNITLPIDYQRDPLTALMIK